MKRREFLTSSLITVGMVAHGRNELFARQADESVMTGPDPLLAAEYLSVLEGMEHIPALYTLYSYMHKDAQQIVPRATVIGWYQADFQPMGPNPAVATGVTYRPEWTWAVTGKTYTNVAEVQFSQVFDNGTVTNDIVRLYWDNGQWNYFFGRDRQWVEEQILRFSIKDHTVQTGNAPFGFDRLHELDAQLVSSLPSTLGGSRNGESYNLLALDPNMYADENMLPTHYLAWDVDRSVEPVPLGYFVFGHIALPTGSDAADLDRIAYQLQNQPPFRLHGWNSAPSLGLPWLHVDIYQNEMVGFVESLFLLTGGKYLHISLRDSGSFVAVSDAIAP